MKVQRIHVALCLALLAAGARASAGEPKVAFLIGEDEYKTWETLPHFAQRELESRGVDCALIHADPQNPNHFPGIEAIDRADVLFISVRRRPLPAAELKRIREALQAGKGLVGIRTASHAFAARAGARLDPTLEQWPDFDMQVLGGKYQGHYANKLGTDITVAAGAKDSSLLTGLGDLAFHSAGSLYKCVDLKSDTQVLLAGATTDAGATVSHPVAWTNEYGKSRVFYTSLGHPDDFQQSDFNRLLVNAVYWAARREPPPNFKPNAPADDNGVKPNAASGDNKEANRKSQSPPVGPQEGTP